MNDTNMSDEPEELPVLNYRSIDSAEPASVRTAMLFCIAPLVCGLFWLWLIDFNRQTGVVIVGSIALMILGTILALLPLNYYFFKPKPWFVWVCLILNSLQFIWLLFILSCLVMAIVFGF